MFADIGRDSWCLSPVAFEAAITPRTRAAIVVNLYGSMPDWDALTTIAERHGIALVEDAAESVGSRWRGRRAGSFGVMSAFSFHGSKTLTTGEGGMLLLDDDRLLDRLLRLRDHGKQQGDTMFLNEEIGWKYKMSSMQAALGLAQLERVDELVERKQQLFGWYRDELADWNAGRLNPDIPGLDNSYSRMTTIVVDPKLRVSKEELIAGLRRRRIDTRPFFSPLSSLPAYHATAQAATARERNRVAYAVTPFGVNLPSALSLTRAEVRQVCGVLREATERIAKRR